MEASQVATWHLLSLNIALVVNILQVLPSKRRSCVSHWEVNDSHHGEQIPGQYEPIVLEEHS